MRLEGETVGPIDLILFAHLLALGPTGTRLSGDVFVAVRSSETGACQLCVSVFVPFPSSQSELRNPEGKMIPVTITSRPADWRKLRKIKPVRR